MTTPLDPANDPPGPWHLAFASGDAVAVTTHHLATDAAVAVMAAGGNAVDGAIAANAVLGVVLPDTCGVGGDLFALVHRPGMTVPAALNASGFAGSGATAEGLRRRGTLEMPLRGPETVTVPGCVDGWEALLAAYGTMPLATVLAPAIALAGDGFAVSVELAESLASIIDLVGGDVIGASPVRTLFPDGAAPVAGTVLRRPDLAATLRLVADGGRAAFYEGPVGRGIVTATGGVVTRGDLALAQAEWVDPVGARIHGRDAWTIPPNSQGYLTFAALIVAASTGAGADPDDPAAQHALIEASRAVASERDDLVTDPATAPLPPDRLLDPARLAGYTAAISDGAAAGWGRSRGVPGGTAYLCTRDGDGMGVSLIQSNFHDVGSGLVAGDTGVFLHNRGAGFTLTRDHPNELAPHRRPLHTLSPTLWTDAGGLRLLLGTRGGHYQPQILAQVASHRLAAGLTLPDAVDAPRWVVDRSAGDGWTVSVESRMPGAVVEGLRRRGHPVVVTGARQSDWGPVAAIEIGAAADRRSGGGIACGDPRVSTSGTAIA